MQVNVNRQRAGQLGVTVDQIGRSFAAATSSSRFVAPNYWADPRTGIAFQVQIEIPQPRMTSLEDLRAVPVTGNGVRGAPLGTAVSVVNGAGTAVIAGNLLSGTPRGAIVGMDHAKAVTGDLSEQPTRYANLQISGNRVR